MLGVVVLKSKEQRFGSFLFFSILRRRFLSLLVLPTIIERRRKERENNLIFTKGTNLKKNELITLIEHLFQSQENVLIRFTDTFGREGVNDFEIEKRLRLSYAAARVLYSTFLLHYLAVFGGVLDDHRHFCVWFLFYFSSLV